MFQEYNLNFNPLTESGLKFKSIDRVDPRKQIKDKLEDSVSKKYCEMFFLTGDYGIGKSFFIADLERRIKEKDDFFANKKVLVATINMIHPKPPSSYNLYLYQQIMESLGNSTFKKLVKEIKDLKNEKILKDIDPDYRTALSFLDSPAGEGIALKFLKGEDVQSRELNSIGIKSEIYEDTALKFLTEFLKLIKILSYDSLIVFIDEFEYIFTAAGKQKATQLLMAYRFVFDQLNKKIDQNVNLTKTIFIFTGTPHSMEVLRVELPGAEPFIQRLDELIINLGPFNEPETKELLESRMNKNLVRIEPDNKDKIGLFPFQDDFVKFIREKSEGNPRKILKLSSFILDIAHQKNLRTIGKADADKILVDSEKTV